MQGARLHYICGAPGSGKQTLVRMARARLPERAADRRLPIFAHRYTSRPPGPTGENHVHLTDAEFDYRLQQGCFAMHWYCNGHYFGIGVEINQWLGKGLDVVMVGALEHLPLAAANYPELSPIVIEASYENRRRRLLQLAVEDAATIERRLQRSASKTEVRHSRLRVIDNNGLLHTGVQALVQLIFDDPPAARRIADIRAP